MIAGNRAGCADGAEDVVAPLHTLNCLYDSPSEAWREFEGRMKQVSFARLRTSEVRADINVNAVLPRNIDTNTGRELVPRNQLKPRFHLSVSFGSRDMESRPPPTVSPLLISPGYINPDSPRG